MEEIIIDIEKRILDSKKHLKKLRNDGFIPCILYGEKLKSEAISIDSKIFNLLIKKNGMNVVFHLKTGNNKKLAIIKSLQKDVITQKIIHVDFQIVTFSNKIDVLVPIHIDGIPIGVKNFNGVMEFVTREIKVKSYPQNIPQKINVNVETLNIGDRITVSDLPKNNDLEYLQDPSTLIITVVSIEEEKTSLHEEEKMEQPELITKNKKEIENKIDTTQDKQKIDFNTNKKT
ncbi:MAG: 50S ribosomal protein L25 [Endomicrobium sp.]|nr:50S ribosomal protein L25 [Endomicrobium sp.]